MPDSEEHENAPGKSAARRVLVVDDSESVRFVLRKMFEDNGVGVVLAEHGRGGLEVLRNDPSIGLVFLDLQLPDIDGLDLLRTLREDPEVSSVPVVVLTGSGPSTSAEDARALGAVGWLQKPVRMDALMRVVRRYLPSA